MGRSGTGASAGNGSGPDLTCDHGVAIDDPTPARSPLELLGTLAKADAKISEQSRLVEIYTMEGLLPIWWWGEPGAKDEVIMCGGAMGGVTGPGRALYVELAASMARPP